MADSRIEDEVFIDIAPENGVIHQMMFYSRLKLLREENPKKTIINRAGSVHLSVNEKTDELNIEFKQHTDIPQEKLIPLIVSAYKQMRSQGMESTLPAIISNCDAEKMAEEFICESAKKDIETFEKKERERRLRFAQKHSAQTPQEERLQQNIEESFIKSEHRETAIINRAKLDAKQDPVARMKEKMSRYSGD